MKKIRYCGNCNPDVHPEDVKKALEELFPDIPGEDISIMVNGCSRACLTKKGPAQKTKGKTIVLSSREAVRRKE